MRRKGSREVSLKEVLSIMRLDFIDPIEEIMDKLRFYGFEMLSYTYDRGKVIEDEFLMISSTGKIIVWINLVFGKYYVYEKTEEPPDTEWEDESFFPPDSEVKAFVSQDPPGTKGNYLFIKIVDESGEETYYKRVFESRLPSIEW